MINAAAQPRLMSIKEAAQADGIAVVEVSSAKEALVAMPAVQPSLMILERGQGDADALEGLRG